MDRRSDVALDVDFARGHFPQLANGWAFMENAGGSYVPRSVVDRTARYMSELQVQPNYGFAASVEATARLAAGKAVVASFLNADASELVIGPSTTMNIYVLAQALRSSLEPGDEIIVTNQDHEANSGAWRRLAEFGIAIREWRADPATGELSLARLDPLLSSRTRLIAMPHCSNIVGTINDVAAVALMARRHGALLAVDGVSYAPHRLPDVKALDVDFYYFSLYKTFGPHVGAMYIRKALFSRLTPQNHIFIKTPPATLNPGGQPHEFSAALVGIADYIEALDDHHFALPAAHLRARFDRIFTLFAGHEDRLAGRLLDGLAARPDIRVIGNPRADGSRAPTLSFAAAGQTAGAVAGHFFAHRVALGHGDFYALRLITALGLADQGGVVRVSLAHYNDDEDVDRFLAALAALPRP